MTVRPKRPTSRRGLAFAAPAGAVVLTVAVAGCGGSSSGGSAGHELAFIHAKNATQQRAAAKGGAAAASTDPVRTGQGPSAARFPTGKDDEGSGGATPVRPCTLVRKSEAAAIVGRAVTRVREAPQGPTCLYQTAGAKGYITVTVESGTIRSVKRHSKALQTRTVRGRKAYCVRYGRVTTYVPLKGGGVLNVTASCPIGAAFAAKAVPRVAH